MHLVLFIHIHLSIYSFLCSFIHSFIHLSINNDYYSLLFNYPLTIHEFISKVIIYSFIFPFICPFLIHSSSISYFILSITPIGIPTFTDPPRWLCLDIFRSAPYSNIVPNTPVLWISKIHHLKIIISIIVMEISVQI